jgi:hypothetical protein
MMFRVKRSSCLYLFLVLLNAHFTISSADSSANLQSIEGEYRESHWMFLRENPHVRLKRHLLENIVLVQNSGSDQISCNATFQPYEISITETELQAVNCSIICTPQNLLRYSNWTLIGLQLHFRIADDTIVIIEGTSDFNSSSTYEANNQYTFNVIESVLADVSFTIRGRSFGKTHIELQVIPMFAGDDVTPDAEVITHDIVVIKANSVINTVYLIILGIMIVMYNFGFGCKIEWARIVSIVKKPVAPAIGFCCQFLIMAPVSML